MLPAEGGPVVLGRRELGVGVLGKHDDAGKEEDVEKQDKAKGGIQKEEHEPHDGSDGGRGVEKPREEHEEQRVDRVDGADADVHDVGGLVEVRLLDARVDGVGQVEQEDHERLGLAGALAQRHEDELDEPVGEHHAREPVLRSVEHRVEEAVLAEELRVAVQDGCRVVMVRDRPPAELHHLVARVAHRGQRQEEEEHRDHHDCRRVHLRELPERENHELREPDVDVPQQRALESGGPRVARLRRLAREPE